MPKPLTVGEAKREAQAAMRKVEAAANTYLDQHAGDGVPFWTAITTLARIAQNSRAEWSGGPLSTNNVEELIVRAAALENIEHRLGAERMRCRVARFPAEPIAPAAMFDALTKLRATLLNSVDYSPGARCDRALAIIDETMGAAQ